MAGCQLSLTGGRGLVIHMVGVCGVGMAGLALLLKERGHIVAGCDLEENSLTDWLRGVGIDVVSGHDAGHITDDTDLVIRSRAVSDDCADIVCAVEKNITVLYRGEVLPQLLEGHVSVAVSGTHGKTTTSSFIAQILQNAKRNPSWCIGAECAALSGVGNFSTDYSKCPPMVVEADESDGTVALYKPDIAVVTNIEFDHMEYFKDEQDFKSCFKTFVHHAKKRVVYCGDDENCAAIISGADAISFGTGDQCNVRAVDVRDAGTGQSFVVEIDGKKAGEISLSVPGRHNVLNALAACAVCTELGLTFESISEGLSEALLPVRRFERVVDRDGIVVISDYAHHPSEISAFIKTAARLNHKRLIAVFEPHRYTRTLALGADFPDAFDGLDELILCPVYEASEAPIMGGTVYDLYDKCRSAKPDLAVKLAASLAEAWAYIRNELREGDVLLVTGAGDVDDIARWAAENEFSGSGFALPEDLPEFKSTVVRYDEPLAKKTTMGVGGNADIWADVGTQADLALLCKWAQRMDVPLRVMGGGSNLLISDLGVRGVTCRLIGEEFRGLEIIEESDNCISVGAGVTVPKLLAWLEQHGLTGLEFLEGIPGMIGGLLRMNAGAFGGEISESVLSIRCLNSDGDECTFSRNELDWGYRECPALNEMIVLDVELCLDRGDQAEADMVRRENAGKRHWAKGLRSAGSVFKNPEEDRSAGELIDQAGLKGKAVGFARVYEGHGNCIVTEKGATASDVKALIELVKAEVRERWGVDLQEEIREFAICNLQFTIGGDL